MNVQGDLADATQPISQSFYEALLHKTKSARKPDNQRWSASQITCEEGDEGHVDITSSFVTRQEQNDDEDFEPVDISPVQTQHALTQFPESQRFKTPATAGKKRARDRDILDTPAPVRNPLIQDGQPTPNGMLGLSQAFAATQAASSPFSNGLPTGPRPDRPSPNIDLQTRPGSTASSSPLLRPITDLRRTTTEPAARYVSLKQSQIQRLQQERQQTVPLPDATDAFEDDFDQENSAVVRRRRQKAREEKAKQELKLLSSPMMKGENPPTSSPSKSTLNDAQSEDVPDYSTVSPTLSTEIDIDLDVVDPVSEAETEQEEDEQVGAWHTDYNGEHDEEDKENASVLVPKTGPRRRTHIEDRPTQVDASPSLRQTVQPSEPSMPVDMHSSEPLRIMDSQPSQSRSRFTSSGRGTTTTGSDIIDFVEHSPNTSNSRIRATVLNLQRSKSVQPSRSSRLQISNQLGEGRKTNSLSSASSVRMTHNTTVPETNSEAHAGLAGNKSVPSEGCDELEASTVVTGNDFETAPTHIQQQVLASSQISSPIRTTPPGRKRKRLLEINDEISPRKSQSQQMFDARALLQIDEDQQVAQLLESSPGRHIDVKLLRGGEADTRALADQAQPVVNDNKVPQTHRHSSPSQAMSSSVDDYMATASEKSRLIRPSRRDFRRYRERTITAHQMEQIDERASIFDVEASPNQKSHLRIHRKPLATPDTGKRTRGRRKSGRESRMQKRLQRSDAIISNTDIDINNSKTTQSLGAVEEATEAGDDARIDVVGEVIAPHMVFAHYKGMPRGYYPAIFLGGTPDEGYKIQWEGDGACDIDSYGVKALDLRVGDTIKVLANGFSKVPYVINGFKDKKVSSPSSITDIRGYQTLLVTPKQRKSMPITATREEQREVPVASIYLDINLWAQLKSRTIDFKPAAASDLASATATPLHQPSTPSTSSSRIRHYLTATVAADTAALEGMFSNMMFAISYEDIAYKNRLTSLIQTNAGSLVYDSFHDLVEPETMHLKPQYEHIGFTALLTDKHSRKEKYMQALALGLPCLSGKWIEACVKHGRLMDWQSYLLPAGESAELDNATKSRVLPQIDPSSITLHKLLESRPILFEGAHVIVVVGRGKAEAKRAPYLFLIRALGASQIDKVADLKSVKDILDSNQHKAHQWVFVEDKDVHSLQNLLQDDANVKKSKVDSVVATELERVTTRCAVAGNELIVQSLILERLYEP